MVNRIYDHIFSNISADTADFTIRGGLYGLSIHAGAWGTITLQRKGADGTYVTALTAFTADGYGVQYLTNGTYKLLVASATGVYAELVSIANAV